MLIRKKLNIILYAKIKLNRQNAIENNNTVSICICIIKKVKVVPYTLVRKEVPVREDTYP